MGKARGIISDVRRIQRATAAVYPQPSAHGTTMKPPIARTPLQARSTQSSSRSEFLSKEDNASQRGSGRSTILNRPEFPGLVSLVGRPPEQY